MSENQKVSDILLEKEFPFSVVIANQNIFHKLGIKKKERFFKIKPLTLGTLVKISELIQDIDITKIAESVEEMQKNNKLPIDAIETFTKTIKQHGEDMINIIAYAITNKKEDPSDKLIKFLRANLTTEELYLIFNTIIGRMGISSFFYFMTSLRGVALWGVKNQETYGEN